MPKADPAAVKPRNLAIAGRELAIAWGDGHESYIPMGTLRRRCPCAMCTNRPDRKKNPLETVEGPRLDEITIARLVPVGAYAVQIVWSDGHDTGIHSYESLRRLCPCAECASG
ncbi:MAG: DUF971 domain-containing protein [Acidobacteriota bacterium]|nr:DUF971 domain-containing protein [Acidobacteriota bacterium]